MLCRTASGLFTNIEFGDYSKSEFILELTERKNVGLNQSLRAEVMLAQIDCFTIVPADKTNASKSTASSDLMSYFRLIFDTRTIAGKKASGFGSMRLMLEQYYN